ncbi:MAG: transketolase [Erysipelotrichaceae bacterium]|nr:transketolase [Erysipelotrichaceae bacterium]
MDKVEKKKLELLAAKIRLDVIELLKHRGYGHLGGSMSIVELMAVLYGKVLHVDPANPQMEDRDMVVLSKGHSGPAWYSALAERGFFPKEWLMTLNDGGTKLPSHPDRSKTPGVDMTTGSLGQGTSSAAGIALGQRLKGQNRFTYMIVGDGELNEGQCWEAFQFVAARKLSNCIVIIDDNKRQLDGYTKDVLYPFDYVKKMEAFGFYTQKVKGDDIEAIAEAIEKAQANKESANCIVLDSIKGQGVKYFEELKSNHSVKFNNDEINKAADDAMAELKEFIAKEEA